MKKSLLISSLLLLILFFSGVFTFHSLEAQEIVLNQGYFNIYPNQIDENTLIVLEEIEEELNISLHKLEKDRFLMIYRGRFYMLKDKSRIIETELGQVELPVEILYINDNLLVPIYLLNQLPGIELNEEGNFVLLN